MGSRLPERKSVFYSGTSLHASMSEPQNSIHLAWFIGPCPITFANRKSTSVSTSLAINVAGGFLVTQRMLEMFKKKPASRDSAKGEGK